MGVKKVLSVDAIRTEYLEKNVSMTRACKALGCCPTTLIKALREYGLEAKPRTWNRSRACNYPQLQDRDWLAEQLKTRTMLDIALELGTTSGNVSDHVKRFGLRWKHYDRMEAVRAGIRKSYPNGRFGKLAANWKGGRRIANQAGYICIYKPDHRYATKDGYVMEHRLVMEEKLGRILEPEEIVHHRNGKKQDNRPENLEVMSRSEHVQLHFDAVERVHELEQENERLKAEIERLREA